MKIVFIQPKTFHTWEALNIGYLASYLKRHGYNDIRFYSGFFDSNEEIINACKDADIVGFSCTSPQMKHALVLARAIKNKKNYIVFGGVHPSALPEDCLETGAVDAVVAGEGEDSFLEIVKGNREKIVSGPYIENLDELPFPDRAVIKQERNIKQAYDDNGIRIASIFSSRGCPFRCAFCASNSVWSRKTRYRSAENILEEFEKVVKDLRVDFVKFSDDTFTVNKRLVSDFCELKLKRDIKTPWGCNVRADNISEGLLRLMHKAGCSQMWVGAESGSAPVLKDMQKGITIESIKRIFKVSKDIGFYRRVYMLLGMPNESLEDIKKSEQLVDEIEPDAVGFTILAPYPGSLFYDRDVHKNVDWSYVDEYENRITSTKYLSNDELHFQQERLVNKYKNKAVFRQRKENKCQLSGSLI